MQNEDQHPIKHHFWAYVSDDGHLLPSTIREKMLDSFKVFTKTSANCVRVDCDNNIRVDGYTLTRVKVSWESKAVQDDV